MRRGEVWTAAGGKDYAGKPRPVVIVQDDAFASTDSAIVRAFTTSLARAPLVRLPIEPTSQNGLLVPCNLMVDKLTSIPRAKLGRRIGLLTDDDMKRLNEAVFIFLGLAVRPKAS